MTNENFSIRANQKDMIYTLNAVQGESQSRTFKFQLKDSTGNTISPLGKTCSFYVTKPDGNIVMIPMTVDGDMALVTLTAQACSIAGYMPCWIQFVDPDGNDLRVDNMRLCIKECNFDAAVESSPEFSALEQALGNVTEMKVHMADHGNPHGVTAGQAGAISASERGVADGVATLDSNSKIPASQIPSLDYIPTTQTGVANGVATLDSNSKIPVSQIPSLDYIPTTQKGAASGVATLDTTGKIPVGQYCEEGTWTPVLDISGGPNISYTIAANRGCKYWTIGDLVYITCYLRVDITSAGSGSTGDRSYASIGGLPFVASSESKYPVTISELYGCVSNKWDKGFIDKSYVYFVKDDGAANEWWLASEFAGINFCGWYKKAT